MDLWSKTSEEKGYPCLQKGWQLCQLRGIQTLIRRHNTCCKNIEIKIWKKIIG